MTQPAWNGDRGVNDLKLTASARRRHETNRMAARNKERESQIGNIVAQLKSGLSSTEVAEGLGITGHALKEFLKRRGIRVGDIRSAHPVSPRPGAPSAWECTKQRFTGYVTRAEYDSCWEWSGPRILPNKRSPECVYGCMYGVASEDSPRATKLYAHRLAYTLANGPIPEGMTVDHICFNTLCVNPAHLQLLTPSENSARKGPMGVAAARRNIAIANGYRLRWLLDATHCECGCLLARNAEGNRFCADCRRTYNRVKQAEHRARVRALKLEAAS